MAPKCKFWRDGTRRQHPNHPMRMQAHSFRHGTYFLYPERPKTAQRLYYEYHKRQGQEPTNDNR